MADEPKPQTHPEGGIAVDAAAQMLEQLRAIQVHLGMQPAPRNTLTVRQCWAEFARVREPQAREGGWSSTVSRMGPILQFFAEREADALGPGDVAEYLEHRVGAKKRKGAGVVSESYAVQEVRGLITMLHALTKAGKLTVNRLAGMELGGGRRKQQRKKRRRVYTDQEIESLLRHARLLGARRVRAVIAVMNWSGVRPGELIQLGWHHRAGDGMVTVPEDVAKTGVEREFPLLADGQAALEELREAGSPWFFPSPYGDRQPISYTPIYLEWVRVAEAANLAPNHDGSRPLLYSMRHTLATRLGFELHWGDRQIADWMGWENAEQASAYVTAQRRHILDQARMIEESSGQLPAVRPRPTDRDVTHISDYVRNRKVTGGLKK